MAQLLIHYEKGVPPTSEELAKKLESKKDRHGTDQFFLDEMDLSKAPKKQHQTKEPGGC